MQNSPQAILTQVLTIIGYSKDKQEFIIEFGDMCINRALATATQSLSGEKQEELIDRIKDIENPDDALKIIGEYVPVEDYQKALDQATRELFEDFLNTIEPDLTDAQSAVLDKYLASIGEKSDESSQQSE